MPVPMLITLKLQCEVGEVGGPHSPIFWHISETVRATGLHMSRKVDYNKHFKKCMIDW